MRAVAAITSLILLLFSQAAVARQVEPDVFAFPLTVGPVRELASFQYMRAFFPRDDPSVDFSQRDVLSEKDRDHVERHLQAMADNLQASLVLDRRSIEAALSEEGLVNFRMPAQPNYVQVKVLDDGGEVQAGALSSNEIVLSARTLRGFLVGSLREALSGSSSESAQLLGITGWQPGDVSSGLAVEDRDRFSVVLDLLEDAEQFTISGEDQKKIMMAAVNRMNSEIIPADPEMFDERAKAILNGRASLDIETAYVLSSSLVTFSMISEPAEKFLIAHELGHALLGHPEEALAGLSDSADQQCTDSLRRERDADIFAVALLVYDALAGTSDAFLVGGVAGVGIPVNEYFQITDASGEPFMRTKYGFPHAFKYGMSEAGMTTFASETCVFSSPEERNAAVQATWRRLLGRRLEAVAALGHFAQTHPTFVASRTVLTSAPLSQQDGERWMASEASACLGAPAWLDVNPNALEPRLTQYAIRCRRPGPTSTDVPVQTLLVAGESYAKVFMEIYESQPSP